MPPTTALTVLTILAVSLAYLVFCVRRVGRKFLFSTTPSFPGFVFLLPSVFGFPKSGGGVVVCREWVGHGSFGLGR